MPRHTIFHVARDKNNRFYQQGDTAQTVLSRIAEQIHKGSFFSRTDVDFENEADTIEAQDQWAIYSRGTRLIVEYERVDNNTIRVLGFRDTWRYQQIANYVDYFYRYNQPLLLNMQQTFNHQPPMAGAVPSGIAEIRQVATNRVPNQDDLNPAQSTHTASVHKTVAESLTRLNNRYSSQMNVENNLKQLEQLSKEITAENYPETTEIERKAAKRFITRMPSLFDNKESQTNLSIKYILALLVEAINDNNNLNVDKKTAKLELIRHFYEIQRGYNLDRNGKDKGEVGDHPICIGGTINKLVDTLNGGFHPDVEILVITKQIATQKFPLLVQDLAIKYIKESKNKEQLINELEAAKTGQDKNISYSIPDSILEKIKEKVKQEFFDEFSGFVNSHDLELNFDYYESVSLNEKQFTEIVKLKNTIADQQTSTAPPMEQSNTSAKVESTPTNNNMVKDLIIQILTKQKNSYEQRVNNQWFSSMRAGAKKNVLIQTALDTAIKHIEKDDFSAAQSVISELKKKLESDFGQNNVWGKKSESFKLVELIEQKLKSINSANTSHAFKEQLKGIKEVQEEQQIPSYNKP